MNFISAYHDDNIIENPQQFTYSGRVKLTSIDIIKFVSHFQRELKTGNPISYKIEQLEVQNKKHDIAEQFEKLSLNDSEENKQIPLKFQFAMSFPISFSNWEAYIKVVMDLQIGKINIVSTIMQNGVILRAKGHNLRQSFTRFLLILNSHLRWGSLTINPISKQIWQTKYCLYDREQLIASVKNPFLFVEELKFEIMCTRRFWNVSTQKILCLVNQSKIRLESNPNHDFAQKIVLHLRQLARILKQSHLQYPFMYDKENRIKIPSSDKLRRQKQEQQETKNKQLCVSYFKAFKRQGKPFHNNINQILKTYSPQFSILHQQHKFASQQLQNHYQLEMSGKMKASNTPGRVNVFSKLQIFSINQSSKKQIQKGGFSSIYVVDVFGKRMEDKKPQNIQLVVKNADPLRIQSQKNVVSLLRNSQCLFVSRYFESDKKQFEHSLLMQYCCHRSLERYLCETKQIISLQTKLFFLVQILIGLRFLRDHDIVHLDIKPQNILAKIMSDRSKRNSTFLLRLIDFGQSYSQHLNHLNNKHRRGFTIPYSSPEITQQKGKYNEKSDVFSFGVMAMQIIFDISIEDLRRLNCNNYKQRYMNYFSFCPQKCRYYGYSDLMVSLYGVFLRCLDTNQRNRPCLNWLCLALKQCLNIMQKIYK